MSLGIGLIGSGYMGKCHAMAWNSVATVFSSVDRPRLLTLADANAELAVRQAQALGFGSSTGDWRDLLTNPEIDVISITTPNQFHADIAIAALEAGKHVWCEKPMAPLLKDAERMALAARKAGKVAILGYNYIQNPLIRLAGKLIRDNEIGDVNHIRLEMDEDYMGDPDETFSWKSERAAGYGALDDFAVHPLSILMVLHGKIEATCADMMKPYETRPTSDGQRRVVENYDISSALFRTEHGASGLLAVNRSAWGRKGRIALQIYGSRGTILYDQERMNELQIYTTKDEKYSQGFKTILAGPEHNPYEHFIPAPGHGLGFNELKVIECHELLKAINGEASDVLDFQTGLYIERTVHAMARSAEAGSWITVNETI